MLLITTDLILRKYLPNAFATVTGESPLFDKLKPFLAASEAWLQNTIVSAAVMQTIASAADDSIQKVLACKFIVDDAFQAAVPSLDLVLTPNGFGVVSNTNVAPASKERVERLVSSLRSGRDRSLRQLLSLLMADATWRGTAQAAFFGGTLFPSFDVVDLLQRGGGVTTVVLADESLWSRYCRLRSQLVTLESDLAASAISQEQMTVFRGMVLAGAFTLPIHNVVVIELKALLLRRLEHALLFPHEPLTGLGWSDAMDIVQKIRSNPTAFPAWHASSTKDLFDPPVFENKKSSSGFWF